jgi:hypothetical protein
MKLFFPIRTLKVPITRESKALCCRTAAGFWASSFSAGMASGMIVSGAHPNQVGEGHAIEELAGLRMFSSDA